MAKFVVCDLKQLQEFGPFYGRSVRQNARPLQNGRGGLQQGICIINRRVKIVFRCNPEKVSTTLVQKQ